MTVGIREEALLFSKQAALYFFPSLLKLGEVFAVIGDPFGAVEAFAGVVMAAGAFQAAAALHAAGFE
jgi:hypothetical protein